MASRQEYLQMMKRMEKGMGEERIPAPMNMRLESMKNLDRMGGEAIPSRLDMGLNSMSPDDVEEMLPLMTDPKIRNLNIPPMRKSELMEMLGRATGQPSDFTMKELEALKGSLSDREMDFLERQRSDALTNAMGAGMGAMSDRDMKALEDAMGGSVSDEIRDAISALISMGIPLETALETLNETEGLASALGNPETNPMTMPEGALGSLPTRTGRRTGGAVSDKEFDPMIGDKTQSLDMQDTATGT